MGNNPKQKIKEFIIGTFLDGRGDLAGNEPLFESGIIDSLGLFKLLAFIEKTFGITVNRSEIVISAFDSLDRIAGLVDRKMEGKTARGGG